MKRVVAAVGFVVFLGVSFGTLWIWSTFQGDDIQYIEGTVYAVEGPYFYIKSMPLNEKDEWSMLVIPVVRITWDKKESVYREFPRKIFTKGNSRTNSEVWFAYPDDKLPLNSIEQSIRIEYKVEDIERDKGVEHPIIKIIKVLSTQ